MTTHKEALMLAIKALEDYGHAWPHHVVQYTNATNAIKEALAQPKQETVGPSGDSLSDFQVDQWWVRELDFAVANGTHDQKRAVSVVRNMLATIAATARNTQPPAQPEQEHDDSAVHFAHCNIGENKGYCKYGDDDCPVITNLKAKNKEPEQEPVAFLANGARFKLTFDAKGRVSSLWHNMQELDGRWVALVAADDDCHLKLTTPPQRKPLTDEQVMKMAREVGLDLEPTRNMLVEVRGQHAQLVNLARAIEAAHGIKGET